MSPEGAAAAVSGPGTTPYGGHAGPVLSVAFAPDGAALASASAADNWDYQAGGCAQIIHSGVVHRPGIDGL